MMDRPMAIENILRIMGPRDFIVCGLGYLSRDLYLRSQVVRARCLYCMGSMGSVLPLSLGVSLARPSVRVLALEGDGSLLMNLGALATLRRYGSPRVRLIVFDNNCYESTGGQPSQPEAFQIERICAAAGLQTQVAFEEKQIQDFLAHPDANVLVIKVATGPAAGRIGEAPENIAAAFAKALAQIDAASTPLSISNG